MFSARGEGQIHYCLFMTRYFFRAARTVKSSLFSGPVLAQKFDGFVSPSIFCPPQRSSPFVVLGIDIRQPGNEDFPHFLVACFGRVVQGRPAGLVLCVDSQHICLRSPSCLPIQILFYCPTATSSTSTSSTS